MRSKEQVPNEALERNKDSITYHKFDLAGLKRGDKFFGCRKCWWQAPANAGVKPGCPICQESLFVYTVTKEDLEGNYDKERQDH